MKLAGATRRYSCARTDTYLKQMYLLAQNTYLS